MNKFHQDMINKPKITHFPHLHIDDDDYSNEKHFYNNYDDECDEDLVKRNPSEDSFYEQTIQQS